MERNAGLDKLIGHYGEKYELNRDVEIAGVTVAAVASLRHRGNISIMGFDTGKTGPEACEHAFVLECESFDDAMLNKISGLVAEAEREYIKPDKGHAYTLLSVVALVADIQKSAAVSLKKFKYRREYGKSGWMLTRVAVFDENGSSFCNSDGSDLKKLIINILK